MTLDLIDKSDLVLLVVDGSENGDAVLWDIIETASAVIVVFNKSDMGVVLSEKDLSFSFAGSVRISAKNGEGINELINIICGILGVGSVDPTEPICFTERQKNLMNQISAVKTKPDVKSLITELLKIQTNV